ncbi:MAG TPA: NrfD/PsrC family molybdoenzyme membrane anchor subunit [Syntrophales bacterium]|nr:NrfD/PsrC family molybdoenzyme membrane anchor subunit [Syntrophales bacterium]
MLEKALTGSNRYYGCVAILLALFGMGVYFYLHELEFGLAVTGMSRDVSWGLYISQFTFLVGIAASAVMVVLPYYLHDYKAFGRITVLGEFLAIAAVAMCVTFIFVNLGQPARVFYVMIHPSFTSVLFWDMVVISVYLVLNVITGWTVLGSVREGVPPPAWVKPFIYISIPWAVSIHTVTAFIYAGMPGRSFWLTAIMAPRFLAAAFASGPALLILLCFVLRRYGGFDAGKQAIDALAKIVTYSFIATIFFVVVELWTVFYSQVPDDMEHYRFLFVGLEGYNTVARFMNVAVISAAVALVLLFNPRTRKKESFLTAACILVFISLWIEKGLGLLVTGFVPSPLGHITRYTPTWPEAAIAIGVWSMGFLIITVLYKIFLSVRESAELPEDMPEKPAAEMSVSS